MIDTKALRSRILDLAIQGKLTEQLPSDGTAEELYQQIQAEKQVLIKEGKIKKEKPLPEISADEIPFELPGNWKWVQLGELGEGINNAFADGPFGSNLKREHYTFEKQVRIIQLSNIGDEGWRNENEKYTTFEHLKTIERSEVFAGNIVIAKMMPAGRAIIVPDTGTKYVLSSDCIKFVPHTCLDTRYICYAINSSFFRNSVIQNVNGIGRERTSLTKLKKCIIPVPPLAEQKRIVERVEEIFRLLDTIDKAQEKYSADSQILKAKLITAGIQGKLTKQLPSDGTAEELYQQIQAEKQKLIKESKLKKEKPLPPVSPEEVPFEIPENWMWVRLSEIVSFIGGYAYKSSDFIEKSDNQVLRLGNVKNDELRLSMKPVYINDELANDTIAFKCKANDILITMTGTRFKRDYFFSVRILCDTPSLYINQRVGCLRAFESSMAPWLTWALKSNPILSDVFQYETGSANQGNLGSENILKVKVPLPPLAEQKRIADVLERALGALE